MYIYIYHQYIPSISPSCTYILFCINHRWNPGTGYWWRTRELWHRCWASNQSRCVGRGEPDGMGFQPPVEKPWKNHGKTMEQPWNNHGTTMEKLQFNGIYHDTSPAIQQLQGQQMIGISPAATVSRKTGMGSQVKVVWMRKTRVLNSFKPWMEWWNGDLDFRPNWSRQKLQIWWVCKGLKRLSFSKCQTPKFDQPQVSEKWIEFCSATHVRELGGTFEQTSRKRLEVFRSHAEMSGMSQHFAWTFFHLHNFLYLLEQHGSDHYKWHENWNFDICWSRILRPSPYPERWWS